MKRPVLVDAQQMALNHPDTFNAPTDAELAAIGPGVWVKVCAAPERFWVSVQAVSDLSIVGYVDNELTYTAVHGLAYADVIKFEPRHVYQISLPDTLH